MSPPTASLPVISVGVLAFNASTYIQDCLHSILEQDYPALQVVVDDGSTHDTAARLQALNDSRVLYRLQPNSGSARGPQPGRGLGTGRIHRLLRK